MTRASSLPLSFPFLTSILALLGYHYKKKIIMDGVTYKIKKKTRNLFYAILEAGKSEIMVLEDVNLLRAS